MRGLEEIIHENNKILISPNTSVTELEVKKRQLEEMLSDIQWRIDAAKSRRK